VHPVPPNQAPIVNAGLNTTITLPASQITLTGSASDSDGTVSSVVWSQISGPTNSTLQNSTDLTAIASSLVEGSYTFKLTATDNQGASGFNYVIVYVSKPDNTEKLPPIVFAGEDITLILPENSVTIIGNAIDPDGTAITDYAWDQVNGEPVELNVSNGNFLTLNNLTLGNYTFRLTVTDDDLLTASDEISVSVIEKSQEIPKFFSPNGDGFGETWVIRNIDSYQTCSLVVFSRSGQQVYKAQPYQNNWDGSFNGKPLSDGDYYYVMSCDDGRKLKGAVRIIR